MGGTDLRRGARWLGAVAAALGLAAAAAFAAPPQGNFTVTPNTPNQDEPALFTCKPCPGSATVDWDLDGVGGFEASGPTATTTFTTAGPHTVHMRLTRDGETNTITKTVTVNAPPSVTFDWDPDSPLAGQGVDFQSQVSDPEADTVTRAWDFGDGATASGAGPNHAYAAAGTYTVTVTATDSNGAKGSATQSIVVRADPGPTSSFDFAPTVPDVGEAVAFTSTAQASQGSIVDVDWDFDGDGQFDDFSGPDAEWVFDAPGTHIVRMRAEQTNGGAAESQASLRVNGIPSADFTWTPASPVAGDSVDLVSTSSDFEGPLAGLSWDLDGDGRFGDGSEAQIRQPFPQAGTYDIGLQVTDSDGRVSTVRKQVVVATPAPPEPPEPPAPPPGAPTGDTAPTGGTNQISPTPRPRLMSPFPVVRIAGTVLPHGALIDVLSVRASRGAKIQVRCLGSGCPVRSIATTSATRLVRLHKFERRLRAGIRIKLFVRQENRIGKYTSVLIRAGEAPKRVDLCLFPTRRSPGRCP
jgi:PKD repeat protein